MKTKQKATNHSFIGQNSKENNLRIEKVKPHTY